MNDSPNYGFYFNEAGLSTSQGATASAEEHFKDTTLEESLVREMAQNSLDAKVPNSEGPVRMEIELRWVHKSEIPDFEELKKHIEAAYESNKDQENDRLKNASEAAQKEYFPVLRIGDYNTTGLTGREDDNEGNPPIVALTRSRGVSSGKAGKGGSFGLGGTVGHLSSDLSTVQWITRTEGAEQTIFAAQSQLATHNMDGKRYGPDGFYLDKNRLDNFHYLRTEDPWDGFPYRTEPGTDTYILGYINAEKDPDLFKIRDAYIEHFFVAIDRGLLVVNCTIDDEESWHLDSSNLERFAMENRAIAPFYRALKEEPVTEVLPDLGEVSLYIKFDSTLDRKMDTMVMRKPLMRVTTYAHTSIREKYAAIFICEGETGNNLLRSTEPPAHNNWVPQRSNNGRTAINRIKRFIRDKLRERIHINRGEEIEIEGLKKLLPSGLGNELFAVSDDGVTTKPEEPGKKESAKVHGGKNESPESKNQPRRPANVSTETPAKPGTGGDEPTTTPGFGKGHGGSGGSKHDSPGSGTGTKGEGNANLLNPLLTMHSWQNPDSNLLTAILRSTEPAKGHIQIVAKNGSGDEEKGYVLPVESVTQVVGNERRDLPFSNNIIKDVEISDSLKTRLEIKFKSNHRFLLELK